MSKTTIIADNGNTLVEPTRLINPDQLKVLFPDGYDSTVNTLKAIDAEGNDTGKEVYLDSPFGGLNWIFEGEDWTIGLKQTRNDNEFIYIKEAEGQGIVIDWCHPKSEVLKHLKSLAKNEDEIQTIRHDEDDDGDWTLYNKINDTIEEIEEN